MSGFKSCRGEALIEEDDWQEDEHAKAIEKASLANTFGHVLQPLIIEGQVAACEQRFCAGPLHRALPFVSLAAVHSLSAQSYRIAKSLESSGGV